MATKTEPLSAKEAAAELGTDARTLRKFLRKKSGVIGQGNRWAIDPGDIKDLRKEFNAWQSEGSKVKPAEDKPKKPKAKSKKKGDGPIGGTDAELYGDDEADDVFEDLDDALTELEDDDEDELEEIG